ncbi:hypothetical protein D917_08680 [Trichinella nativa]|uniref:Uncharacterized protein n=1 Tax=Trichinella nativa TaxID=6335 RepID=A0A1Y3EJ88_9BILA|nr:hypothetical protein D917_00032 [Trichinella nativa]OUC45045.1 hypothetical protein D917_08680 [Trichinella nativa]
MTRNLSNEQQHQHNRIEQRLKAVVLGYEKRLAFTKFHLRTCIAANPNERDARSIFCINKQTISGDRLRSMDTVLLRVKREMSLGNEQQTDPAADLMQDCGQSARTIIRAKELCKHRFLLKNMADATRQSPSLHRGWLNLLVHCFQSFPLSC